MSDDLGWAYHTQAFLHSGIDGTAMLLRELK